MASDLGIKIVCSTQSFLKLLFYSDRVELPTLKVQFLKKSKRSRREDDLVAVLAAAAAAAVVARAFQFGLKVSIRFDSAI